MIVKFLLAKCIRDAYNRRALGHSLMVELRTLTPSVLVRIQLPQPIFKRPGMGRFNIGLWCVGLCHATICCTGSTMSKREQTKCSSSANECPAGILCRGNPAAPTKIQTLRNGIFFLTKCIVVLYGCGYQNLKKDKV